ncbi:hypothetical protein SASPL_126124 [Salvia splendens]|uniref:Dehydrin n=1 Tax=Salvia splendens TaxID=180675 RepID=A0A8X8XF16_SALSN|nr:late embryogenesis abundant protein-like [Salvia splendens]KAG6413415.1 hypothetical protein SASPL_126124 [Salvia splendens]
MADLRDEHGNPIQLADQFGKPVQLTDEHGNPMYITGVATTHGAASALPDVPPVPVAEPLHAPPPEPQHQSLQEQLPRSGSSSSSSSSSEDDGQGGRRKKKGVKEKIKESFSGGKHKDVTHETTTTEKKGIMEKIKEKLPGHHHNP